MATTIDATAQKTRRCGLDEALEDIKQGRIHKADSVEDFFAKMEEILNADTLEAIRQVKEGEVTYYNSADELIQKMREL